MLKSKMRFYLVVFCLLCSFAVMNTALYAADYSAVKGAYDQYLKSYNEFKAAADQNSDQDSLRQLAEKYKAALENYQSILKTYNKEAAPKPKAAEPAETGRVSEAEEVSQAVPAKAAAAVATSLDEVTKSLRAPGAKDRADQLIAQLENISKTSRSRDEANRAKLELANAYAKYKFDYNKAVAVLQEVVSEVKSGPMFEEANRAYVRARYCQEKSKLSAVINQTRAVAKDKKAAYSSISWTSPLSKIKSMVSYYKDLSVYRKSISEFKSYQENGEFDKTYVNYEFLTDIVGKRPEFGVEDTFANTSMPVDDAMAQIRLITDNNEAWYARWFMINEAKQTIDMTYFIFEKDAYGKAMLGLLIDKARQGVKIRLMVDARGSKALAKTFMGQDYLQKLIYEPNVQVKVFNPMHKALPSTFSNIRNLIGSNHQKIIVVDGIYSITGGRNVSLNYFADPADNTTVFRDTDVLLKGEAIAGQMKAAFEEEFTELGNFEISKDLLGNWSHKEKELLAARKCMDKWIRGEGLLNDPILKEVNEELATYKKMVHYKNYEPFAASYNAPVKLFGKHNFQTEKNDITENIIALMDACTQEIIVQNPYVILTEKSRAALKRASDRGVKIIMHTNSPVSTDSILTQAFFLKDWKEVMKAMPNARVFVFVGANKLHAKTFVFDRVVSAVGTYNMDYMSEQINSEDVCAVSSREFSQDMVNRIFEDIKASKEYKIQVNADGSVTEVFGPGEFTSKKTMFILETLMKLNILKPLI